MNAKFELCMFFQTAICVDIMIYLCRWYYDLSIHYNQFSATAKNLLRNFQRKAVNAFLRTNRKLNTRQFLKHRNLHALAKLATTEGAVNAYYLPSNKINLVICLPVQRNKLSH